MASKSLQHIIEQELGQLPLASSSQLRKMGKVVQGRELPDRSNDLSTSSGLHVRALQVLRPPPDSPNRL
jgi:hypothetical protein